MPVRIQREDFDVARELEGLRAGNARIGAIASFVGLVRDVSEASEVRAMTLEHYPGMTEKALAQIIEVARSRWDIVDALVIHRVCARLGSSQPATSGRLRERSRPPFSLTLYPP